MRATRTSVVEEGGSDAGDTASGEVDGASRRAGYWSGVPGVAAQDATGVSAKTWVGYEAEFEEFLKTAEILGLEDIPVGVTNPKSASLAPGGPIDRFAWKALSPGIQRG